MEWFSISYLFCSVSSTLPHFIALVFYHPSVKPALVSSWKVFRHFLYKTYDMLVTCEKFRGQQKGREIFHNILTGKKKKKKPFPHCFNHNLVCHNPSIFHPGLLESWWWSTHSDDSYPSSLNSRCVCCSFHSLHRLPPSTSLSVPLPLCQT